MKKMMREASQNRRQHGIPGQNESIRWGRIHSTGEGIASARSPHSLLSGISVLLLVLLVAGCQGTPKSKPPIHLNPNMDNQPKYLPQSSSDFFAGGSTSLRPVEGTVARGQMREDDRYFRGMDPRSGKPVTQNPVPLSAEGLLRGQERYNIYCSVCHGAVGNGKGIVVERGYMPPPDFHSDLLRGYPDGHIFDVISNGIRNMPGYAAQIPVEDRWLIVHYLRALQRSQHATMADVPPELRDRIR